MKKVNEFFNPKKGVYFVSSVSGLYYSEYAAAGDISKVIIDERVYIPEKKAKIVSTTKISPSVETRKVKFDYTSGYNTKVFDK